MSALLVLYFGALAALAAFGLHRLVLTRAARRPPPVRPAPSDARPPVLVQLPLYNEAFVAERLLRAVAALRWPRDALRIQVLDDSSDATTRVVERVAAELVAAGVDVRVVRRPDRRGFKAGALAWGLEQDDAPYVAIFDADFVPTPDFLEATVPVLDADPGCGLVQARWDHLNRERSLLTRAQALFLDGHFGVEHRGRQALGLPFNFNGTAGVWRRRAIVEAGGWRDDTITEDLDLSYRAQRAGWRFAYLDQVRVPAELPESWMAFRAQQARWVKGSIETARRQLGAVLSAPDWSLRTRLEAALHLTSNATYVLMAALAVLLPPAVVGRDQLGWRVPGGQALLSVLDFSMLTAGTCAMIAFYAASIRWAPPGASRGRYRDLPFALCLGAGMSLSNARQVLLGLFSSGSEFVRTPKRGDRALEVVRVAYRAPAGSWMAVVELGFAVYYGATLIYALRWGLWGALPFLALYLVGFVAVGGGVLREAWQRVRRRPGLAASPQPSR